MGIYTQFYWKVNLWNLLRFLCLRADTHAQYEIRAYADAILAIVEKWVPWVYAAFKDYMLDAQLLSGQATAVLRAVLASNSPVSAKAYNLSGRELRELQEVFPELSGRVLE